MHNNPMDSLVINTRFLETSKNYTQKKMKLSSKMPRITVLEEYVLFFGKILI